MARNLHTMMVGIALAAAVTIYSAPMAAGPGGILIDAVRPGFVFPGAPFVPNFARGSGQSPDTRGILQLEQE
jgi:hypothetical protein